MKKNQRTPKAKRPWLSGRSHFSEGEILTKNHKTQKQTTRKCPSSNATIAKSPRFPIKVVLSWNSRRPGATAIWLNHRWNCHSTTQRPVGANPQRGNTYVPTVASVSGGATKYKIPRTPNTLPGIPTFGKNGQFVTMFSRLSQSLNLVQMGNRIALCTDCIWMISMILKKAPLAHE